MTKSARQDLDGDHVYRLLVQGITDYAIYLLDMDGFIQSWNKGAELAKGYRPEEVIGTHFSRFFGPDDQLQGRPGHALVTARTTGSFEGEGWRFRKDGSRFWAHVVIDPIYDENGQHVGFAKITKDRTAAREAQQALDASERRFRYLVQGVKDYAIYMLDPNGIVSNWNAGAERAKGYKAEEIVGRHFRCFYPPEDQARGEPEKALATARRDGRFEAHGRRFRKDGTSFWAHVVIDPVLDEEGHHLGFTKITRDMTAEKLAADRLAEIRHNLDLALSNMSQGVCLFGNDGRLVLSNHRLLRIFGLEPSSHELPVGLNFEEVLERLLAGVASLSAADAHALAARQLSLLRGNARGASVEDLPDGRSISITHGRMVDGSWVSTIEDVTERRQAEAQISHMALHDGLTGLPNRLLLKRELADALLALPDGLALLQFNLIRFKEVNGTFGHATGDSVLAIVADRLRQVARRGDLLSRIGGDEFVLVRPGETDRAALELLARQLVRVMTQPVTVDGQSITLSLGVGMAVAPDDTDDANELLKLAELALFHARTDGAGECRFFERHMSDAFERRKEMETAFRTAIISRQFEVYYQPLVRIPERRLAGFEALVRWNRPGKGMVSPAEFIPVAEKSGAIVQLGGWVLQTACMEAARWAVPVTVAVNVSAVQFKRDGLVEAVRVALATSGLDPDRLELEITETAIMEDLERTLAILHELKGLGVRIAMDDFGTGYSSLSLLRNFSFDKVKIDRSFVNELGASADSEAIVRAVTSLCSTLGVTSTAEGVETEAQLSLLEEQGCDQVQGYFFSRPAPAGDVDGLIARLHGAAVAAAAAAAA